MLAEMKPPRSTQICCASGVSRYWISDCACGRVVEHAEQVAAAVTPELAGSMSGNGKKSNSSAVAPASISKKSVMKLAWWWNRQPGGSVNIGFAALPKLVALTYLEPP